MNNNQNNNNQRSRSDSVIDVIDANLNRVSLDVNRITSSLDKSMQEVSEAINRLVSLEEKAAHQNQNLERVLKIAEKAHERIDAMDGKLELKVDKLEERLHELEKAQPTIQLVSKWVLAGVLGLVALVGAALIKLVLVTV